MILKFIKNSSIAKTTLKKNEVGGLILIDINIMIKTVWCWYGNRQIDQWNKTERPEA